MNAVLRDPETVSDSVLDDMIGVWRHARTSGGHVQGWPSGLLGRLVELGVHALAALRGRIGLPSMWHEDPTPYIIQEIVDKMPRELRDVFEADYLAIVRGDSCKGEPRKYRAVLLAISEPTYYRRREAGREFVRTWLTARQTAQPLACERYSG